MDSRLRAALAEDGVTPISRATWLQPLAQSSALTVSHAMCFDPVFPMLPHSQPADRERARVIFLQPPRLWRDVVRGRPTDRSHFVAVGMQTPCLLATTVGESPCWSPGGTGHCGSTGGFGGAASRLRAFLAPCVVTPISFPA